MPSSQSDERELTLIRQSPKNLDEVNQSVKEWREHSQKAGQLEPSTFAMMDDSPMVPDVIEDQPPPLTTSPAHSVPATPVPSLSELILSRPPSVVSNPTLDLNTEPTVESESSLCTITGLL